MGAAVGGGLRPLTNLFFRLGMHEGAAAPSYLRPGLGVCRAGVPVRKQSLRTFSRAKRGLRNPQNRLCGSRLEALWASKSASPTATAKSEILTPRRWSGPSGRFLYHFSSRPGPRFTCPGFRPCGALRRCPRASSRVNAASDRPSPKVTKEGRASARLATAN